MASKDGFNLKTSASLLAIFAIIRFVFAFAQRSSFHPDEHWQGPEVAYRIAFGSTEKSWEWYESVALRSHLHPMMFAIFYKMAALLHLDFPVVIAYGPRFVQGLLSAFADVSFYLIGKKLFGANASAHATTFYITSWFSVFTLSRTTSNAADAAITLIGLGFLIYDLPVFTAAAAAICFIMRPPSSLFWLPVCVSITFKYPFRVTLKCLLAAVGLILGVCALDRYQYGVPEGWLAPWNFVKYNIVMGIAKQYGEDPWFYYFVSQLLHYLIFLPWVMSGLPSLPKPWLVGLGLGFTALSLSGHKELRFLSPFFAVVSLGAGSGMVWLKGRLRWVMLLGVVVHAFNAIHLSRWTSLSAEVAITKLRQNAKDGETVFFLGCHQTPLRFFLHGTNVKIEWLNCSPWPVRTTEVSDRDMYFDNPAGFIENHARAKDVGASDWVVVEGSHQQELMGLLKNKWGFEMYGGPILDRVWIFDYSLDDKSAIGRHDLNILRKIHK